MSLLNKMLVDLETRAVRPATSDPAAAVAGLRVALRSPRRGRGLVAGLVVLVLLGVGVALYHFGFHRLPVRDLRPVPGAVVPVVASPPARARRSRPRVSAPKPAFLNRSPRTMYSARSSALFRSAKPFAGAETPAALMRMPAAPALTLSVPGVHKVLLPVSPAAHAQALYLAAVAALRAGRAALAVQNLRQALQLEPEQVSYRLLLATLELQSGQVAQARQDLQQGVALQPQAVDLVEMLAHVTLQTGGPAQALAVLQAHAQGAARHAGYFALRAALEEELGEVVPAAQDYRQALALHPRRGAYWAGLGIALQGAAPAQARQSFRRALADPALPPALRAYCEKLATSARP